MKVTIRPESYYGCIEIHRTNEVMCIPEHQAIDLRNNLTKALKQLNRERRKAKDGRR